MRGDVRYDEKKEYFGKGSRRHLQCGPAECVTLAPRRARESPPAYRLRLRTALRSESGYYYTPTGPRKRYGPSILLSFFGYV